MKLSILAWVSVAFLSFGAQAAEIATVSGQPSDLLKFGELMIQERINLAEIFDQSDSTTWIYSILERKGVQSAVSVEVLSADGNTTTKLFYQGIELAATKAPVVYTNVGPIDNEGCVFLSKHPETAFVIVAGNETMPLEADNCMARNILMVTALNQESGTLMNFANWGPPVRIAAPSSHISAMSASGEVKTWSNTTVGASLVAGKLAVYGTAHPELKGAELIEKFLDENTKPLPALEGKVERARALVDDVL